MKNKSVYLILTAVLMALISFPGLAQEKTIVDSIKEGGNVGEALIVLMYFIVGGMGVFFVATGLKRILSKDNDDEQTKRGGGTRIAIGLVLAILPVFMSMSTKQFTGVDVDKEEITQNPFGN